MKVRGLLFMDDPVGVHEVTVITVLW